MDKGRSKSATVGTLRLLDFATRLLYANILRLICTKGLRVIYLGAIFK